MQRKMLAKTVIGVQEWLAKRSGFNKVVTIIVIVVLASIGFYFLGILGAVFGILLAVGMIDELLEKKNPNEHKKRYVFCSQCGAKQKWAEDKSCEICGSLLHN